METLAVSGRHMLVTKRYRYWLGGLVMGTAQGIPVIACISRALHYGRTAFRARCGSASRNGDHSSLTSEGAELTHTEKGTPMRVNTKSLLAAGAVAVVATLGLASCAAGDGGSEGEASASS